MASLVRSRLSRGMIALSVMVVLIGITMGLAERIEWQWEEWKPATCMPDHCFCETVQAGTSIRQPSNTWSNYAFVLVGIWALLDSVADLPANATGVPIMASSAMFRQIFGGSVVLVGFGSLFYHASMTFVGQWFDVMGMYFITTFAVLYNAILFTAKPHSTLAKNAPTVMLVLFVIANALLGYMLIVVPEYRRQVFFAMVLAVIVACGVRANRKEIKGITSPSTRYFIYSASAMALAFGIWVLDLLRIVCTPDSLIQGHAIWHCLCALSAYYLYLFYCSEAPTMKSH